MVYTQGLLTAVSALCGRFLRNDYGCPIQEIKNKSGTAIETWKQWLTNFIYNLNPETGKRMTILNSACI